MHKHPSACIWCNGSVHDGTLELTYSQANELISLTCRANDSSNTGAETEELR